MGNIIRLNEAAPNGEWIVMSNRGTDCFLDLLIIAADALKKTENQERLAAFLKAQRGINEIAPGTAGFDLGEMPWRAETLKADAEFLVRAAQEAESERAYKKLPYGADRSIVLPWLRQFGALLMQFMADAGNKSIPVRKDESI